MKMSMRFYAYILCTYPSFKTNKKKVFQKFIHYSMRKNKQVIIAFKLHGKYTFNAMTCYVRTLTF